MGTVPIREHERAGSLEGLSTDMNTALGVVNEVSAVDG